MSISNARLVKVVALLIVIVMVMTKTDMEIYLAVLAWFSNFKAMDKTEIYIARNIIIGNIGESPTKYVLNYDKVSGAAITNNSLRILSFRHWSNFMLRLKKTLSENESIESAYLKLRGKIKGAPHVVLSFMLSGETGFPTSNSKCTFYTYYLYLYLLSKHRVWSQHTVKDALIPCNSVVIKNALSKGYLKKAKEPTLRVANELTNVARAKYGNENFYKMYEELNYE